jgi:hypothetical protein
MSDIFHTLAYASTIRNSVTGPYACKEAGEKYMRFINKPLQSITTLNPYSQYVINHIIRAFQIRALYIKKTKKRDDI